MKPGRGAWIQLISGKVSVNNSVLSAGDGAALEDEATLQIKGAATLSEFLLFDLA